MATIAFDLEKYLKVQKDEILKRINSFDSKLYLEFGGKLFDDFHASRVLPGFAPDSKLRLLLSLKDKSEIIIVVNSKDISSNKVRNDLGITYQTEVERLIKAYQALDFTVNSVVFCFYEPSPLIHEFEIKLKHDGIKTYKHYRIAGYPQNTPLILSNQGLGKNEYIETTKPLVVVTAPGPGSGKMATCLSQLYHDNKRGIRAGYAKYETFPIWNLPLSHPVNLAYEAATVDLNDVNMIDPFHLEAYGKMAVNYNRDVETFPLLRTLFEGIYGGSPYKSPTDMGVNMAGFAICNDEAAREASKQEIIRRSYQARKNIYLGRFEDSTSDKIDLLMNQVSATLNDRKCVKPALTKYEKIGEPAVAIELDDGRIITGKRSELLGSSSAALLNALKALAGIQDDIPLIEPSIIGPICDLKVQNLGHHNPRLHVSEVLIALRIAANSNYVASKALSCLPQLKGTQAHSSHILSEEDLKTYEKLGIQTTEEARHFAKRYIKDNNN